MSTVTDPASALAGARDLAARHAVSCGQAEALMAALSAAGWTSVLVSASTPNYDRMDGPLCSASAGTEDYGHPDHPDVIRITSGRNQRAGTSWGAVTLLEGDTRQAAAAAIAAEREHRARLDAEKAWLAALPPVAMPGAEDAGIAEFRARAREVLYHLAQAGCAGHGWYLYGSPEGQAMWDAAIAALHAARQAMDQFDDRLRAAETWRETHPRA